MLSYLFKKFTAFLETETHYHIQKSPLISPILRQTNSVDTLHQLIALEFI